MRVARALKWAALAVAVLAAVAVAILLSVDVSSYRDEITAEFRKATGRGLVIGGDIDLSLSLTPAIVVERVAVANAGWGSRPAMVLLERAEAEVELLPLLAGKFRVTRLILVEPDILLEVNADGLANWRTGPPADPPAPPTARSGPEQERGKKAEAGPPPVPVFSHVEIRRGRLAYRDARTGEDMRFDLDRVSARAESFGAPLEIDAGGAWNGSAFRVSGTVDSLADIAAGRPVRLDLAAGALGFDAQLAGTVAEPGKPAGLDLRVRVRGAGLASLSPIAGPDLPKLGPVAFDARIEGGADRLRIEDIEAALAASDISGRLDLALAGPRPRLSGTLASTAIDLAGLRSKPAGAKRLVSPGGGAKPAKAPPERVFSDDPFSLDGLRAVDLDLELSVERLAGLAVPLEAVRTRMRLEGGALAMTPFSAAVAGSPVQGELHIDARGATPGLRLTARAPDLDVGRLLAAAGVTGLFQGKARASADLSGSGASMAALMAGLDGDIRLVGGSGRLETQAFDAAVGGAGALLGALFSGRTQWTVVNCAVASVGIEKGRAAVRAALIDTEYSTVAATGAADLASERLDLTVEPRAKSPTLTVAVPVRVGGTFAEPEFRPETGAALKKLGGLVAIALFPPAAIAGLGELGGGGNECLKTAAARPAPQPAPASPEKAIRQLRDNLKGAVKDIRRSLKGLLRRNGD